jgi:hypothetical protein
MAAHTIEAAVELSGLTPRRRWVPDILHIRCKHQAPRLCSSNGARAGFDANHFQRYLKMLTQQDW